MWRNALIVFALVLAAMATAGGPARAQQVRECAGPADTGCQRALVVTGGQCKAIGGDPAPGWRRQDIDRFTNACYTCDDLDMDFAFGEQLGFFRCKGRQAATPPGPMPVGPAPDPVWQQRECTRFGLQRENNSTLALTVENQCGYPISINACATWHEGRQQGPGSADAEPGGQVVLRWPVDVYTRAQVVWNYCPVGESCPAPCR